MTTPLPRMAPIERALFALLVEHYAPAKANPLIVNRRMPGSLDGLYVRIERVGGSSTQLEGEFVVDLETFHPKYNDAESASLDLEALVLGYPHVVEVAGRKVVLDLVRQNQGPVETYWDDDSVTRFLATYVITARRR